MCVCVYIYIYICVCVCVQEEVDLSICFDFSMMKRMLMSAKVKYIKAGDSSGVSQCGVYIDRVNLLNQLLSNNCVYIPSMYQLTKSDTLRWAQILTLLCVCVCVCGCCTSWQVITVCSMCLYFIHQLFDIQFYSNIHSPSEMTNDFSILIIYHFKSFNYIVSV